MFVILEYNFKICFKFVTTTTEFTTQTTIEYFMRDSYSLETKKSTENEHVTLAKTFPQKIIIILLLQWKKQVKVKLIKWHIFANYSNN